MKKVAIIEDDRETSDTIKEKILSSKLKVSVDQYFSHAEAVDGIKNGGYSVILLDNEIGDGNDTAGIGIMKEVIKAGIKVNVIVVSGLDNSKFWRKVTKELGAWEYFEKPIASYESLLNQLENLLGLEDLLSKSSAEDVPVVTEVDELKISNVQPRKITWKGKEINPPATARAFLELLVQDPGKTYTYEEFYELVKTGKNKENIKSHMRKLRDAFEDVDSEFNKIVYAYRRGYQWV